MTNRVTLYELDEQYQQAIDNLSFDPETGEIKEFSLDDIEGELNEKRLRVAAYIKNLEAEAAQFKARCDEVIARKKAVVDRNTKRADAMRSMLVMSLRMSGHDEVKGNGDIERIKLKSPTKSVDIFDEDKLIEFCENNDWTSEYELPLFKQETKIVPIKNNIKEFIEGGHEVPGAVIVTKQNVDIK